MKPLVLTDKPFPEPEWFKEAKAKEARALAGEGTINRIVRRSLQHAAIKLHQLAIAMHPNK
jgi:hypothetical protein